MRTRAFALGLLLFGLAACSKPTSTSTNAPHLWLATIDGNESHLQLSPIQPNPF